MPEFIDIGSECFATPDGLIISWKGENYYKACGYPIVKNKNGTTHCVKRVGHPDKGHEDYNGVHLYERPLSASEESRRSTA